MSLLFCFMNSEVLDILKKKILRFYRSKFGRAQADGVRKLSSMCRTSTYSYQYVHCRSALSYSVLPARIRKWA